MTGDADRREEVLLHDALGDDDAVLVVEALPWHVGNREVGAEGELGVIDGGAVGERLAGLDLIARVNDRTVVDAGGLVGALVLGEVVALGAVLVGVDHHVSGVDLGDGACVGGADELAGVERGTLLHAGANERRMRLDQRHGLALHVGAHEGTLGVVVLEERDEVGGHREQLARRDVHVVHVLDVHLGGGAEGAVEVARAGDDALGVHDLTVVVELDEVAGLGVKRRVGGGDVVRLLLVGRHPVDLVGHLAVNHATVRRLDEAVLVHARIERETTDKADVGAFGGLDRAHAGVVRVVNVADGRRHVGAAAGAGLVTGKAAGAERGEGALVREAGKRVGLVHELRELRGAKELLDRGHDRADVDEALRRDVVGVLGGHALANHALHAAHANAELVLDKLAHGADATVAKVVDVVDALGLVARVKREQVADGRDDVLVREHAGGGLVAKLELLVHLVATNAREVIALLVEVEAIEQQAAGVRRGGLAGALALVNLLESVDLVVGLGDAEGAQEHDGGLTALAVDGDHEVAALVDLKLEPRAARGDELHLVDAHAVVHLGGEVHAGRAHELRDNHALGTVDDEGAAVGHEREVAHEHELLLHLARLLVDKANVNKERRLVGDVLRAALGDGVRRVAKLVVPKDHLHRVRGVLDGRELGEGLRETLAHEVLKRLLLDGVRSCPVVW